jgi:hypothetical protein
VRSCSVLLLEVVLDDDGADVVVAALVVGGVGAVALGPRLGLPATAQHDLVELLDLTATAAAAAGEGGQGEGERERQKERGGREGRDRETGRGERGRERPDKRERRGKREGGGSDVQKSHWIGSATQQPSYAQLIPVRRRTGGGYPIRA